MNTIKVQEKQYVLTETQLMDLLEGTVFLGRLEAGGLDKWDGYEGAKEHQVSELSIREEASLEVMSYCRYN